MVRAIVPLGFILIRLNPQDPHQATTRNMMLYRTLLERHPDFFRHFFNLKSIKSIPITPHLKQKLENL
jgi:hypothetical protein